MVDLIKDITYQLIGIRLDKLSNGRHSSLALRQEAGRHSDDYKPCLRL